HTSSSTFHIWDHDSFQNLMLSPLYPDVSSNYLGYLHLLKASSPFRFAFFSFGLAVALDILFQAICSWISCRSCKDVHKVIFFWNTGRSLGILVLQMVFNVLSVFPEIATKAVREIFLDV